MRRRRTSYGPRELGIHEYSNHAIAAADVRACSRSVGADLESVLACDLLHIVDGHLLMVKDARGEASLDGSALEDIDEMIGAARSG